MQLSILASGSKGNSCYIKTNNHNILIDIGLTSLTIERRLKQINVEPKDIDIILLTHTHVDHIAGLKVFVKKYKPKVYLSRKMYKELGLNLLDYEILEDEIKIDTLFIETVQVSHDVECNGYILTENNKSVVYITDTGYIHEKNYEKLSNKNIYVIESNHDVEMLMTGKYPYHLKQRILSSRGHLSNDETAYYLKQIIGPNTEKVYLAHLSEENNTPEKAYSKTSEILEKTNIELIVASQNEETELITVW